MNKMLAWPLFGAFLLFLFIVVLTGCAPKPFMPIGGSVATPSGAADYCRRNPGDELCE